MGIARRPRQLAERGRACDDDERCCPGHLPAPVTRLTLAHRGAAVNAHPSRCGAPSPKTAAMADLRLSDPLAWRTVKAPSLDELEAARRGGVSPAAAEIPRAVRRARDPGRGLPDRRGARAHGRGDRVRPARPVPGRRPAVPLGKRAGADAQHDLALPPADPRLLGRARRDAGRRSSPTCWCTRSATISASPTTTWRRSRRARPERSLRRSRPCDALDKCPRSMKQAFNACETTELDGKVHQARRRRGAAAR